MREIYDRHLHMYKWWKSENRRVNSMKNLFWTTACLLCVLKFYYARYHKSCRKYEIDKIIAAPPAATATTITYSCRKTTWCLTETKCELRPECHTMSKHMLSQKGCNDTITKIQRNQARVRERCAKERNKKKPTENNNKNQKMFGFHCIITNSFISSSQVRGLYDSEQKERENKHDKTVMSVNIMRAAAPYLFYVCMATSLFFRLLSLSVLLRVCVFYVTC